MWKSEFATSQLLSTCWILQYRTILKCHDIYDIMEHILIFRHWMSFTYNYVNIPHYVNYLSPRMVIIVSIFKECDWLYKVTNYKSIRLEVVIIRYLYYRYRKLKLYHMVQKISFCTFMTQLLVWLWQQWKMYKLNFTIEKEDLQGEIR
jgi:hypothetical protein